MDQSVIRKIFFFFTLIWLQQLVISCQHTEKKERTKIRHLAEIEVNGAGMLYLDAVPIESIMRKQDTASHRVYYSFLVGFRDKVPGGNAQQLNKYFEYEMYKDWRIVKDRDSIIPVFFYPKAKMNPQVREGILVFEMAKGERPDTLFYRDSFGLWGEQWIVLRK